MITVDDVNSTIQRYAHNNILHTIDTGLIGTFAFSDVNYDFCVVGHSISGSNHTFTFKVVNSNWTGGFYVLNSNGEYVNSAGWTFDSSTNTLTIFTTLSSIKLVLYCRGYNPDTVDAYILQYTLDSSGILYKHGAGDETYRIYYNNLMSNTLYFECAFGDDALSCTTGSDSKGDYIEFTISNAKLITINAYKNNSSGQYLGTFYLSVFFVSVPIDANVPNPVTVGKVNKVLVDVNSQVGTHLTGTVTYKGKTVDLQYDSYDGYYFMLDLTDKTNDRDVTVTFDIKEAVYINATSFDLRLDCRYVGVASENDFLIELLGGAKIIELTDDVLLTNNVNIGHDLLLIGNGNTFDCDTYSIITNANVQAKDVVFTRGSPVFIQEKDTKLELTGCRFNYAGISTDYVTASVIYCDINVESLSKPDDYVTIIDDCFFYQCDNACIFHGGNLTVTNSKYFNSMTNGTLYPNNPAFLYQTDGDAMITGSVFDIDTGDSDTLCSNEVNLEYAQALFICGETATINNASYIDLNQEDNVNFFNQPYNNLAHIFADYYYPHIEGCVYVSPTSGNEDKAMCYSVSGVDWIFKKNVQVTRKGWGTENTTRKIVWSD